MAFPPNGNGSLALEAQIFDRSFELPWQKSWQLFRISYRPDVTLRKSGMNYAAIPGRAGGIVRGNRRLLPEYNADREGTHNSMATRTYGIWALHSILDAFGSSAGVAAISHLRRRTPEGIAGEPSCFVRSTLFYHRAAHAADLLDCGEGAYQRGQCGSADDLLSGWFYSLRASVCRGALESLPRGFPKPSNGDTAHLQP